MSDTEQAHATFERIVQLQDENELLRVQRNTLSDLIGQLLDENAQLKNALGLDMVRIDSKTE